jgi:hypothetical protein
VEYSAIEHVLECSREKSSVRDLSVFAAFLDIRAYISSPNPTAASENDLNFKYLVKYSTMTEGISQVAMVAL